MDDRNFNDKDRRNFKDRDRDKDAAKNGFFFKKKICKFCTNNVKADYKDHEALKKFITERGKILPRRITGNCDKHQRALAVEIKKARTLAYIPFAKK